MKYTLSINQLGAAIAGLSGKLDIIDLAIFDAFKDFAGKSKCEKKIEGNRVWFWISYSLILKDIPFVPVYTKDAVYRRMKKLADAEVIEFHPDNQRIGKTFFAWGKNYDSLIATDFSPEQIKALQGVPTDADPYPYGLKPVPPTDEKPDNPYTNNPSTSTKNSIMSESENSDGVTFKVTTVEQITIPVEATPKREKPPIAEAPPRVTIKEPIPAPLPKRDSNDPREYLDVKIANDRAIWRYLKAIGGKEKEMEAISKQGKKMTDEYAIEYQIDEVVTRLNEKANMPRGYRTDKKETRTAIRKRLKEYSVDDLYTVVDFKCKEWKDDAKLRQYLRPDTLFNGHFEDYLNAALLDKQSPLAPKANPYEPAKPVHRASDALKSTVQPAMVD